MKHIEAKIPKSIGRGAKIVTCDNSGARIVRVISIKGSKTKNISGLSGGEKSLSTIALLLSIMQYKPGMQ